MKPNPMRMAAINRGNTIVVARSLISATACIDLKMMKMPKPINNPLNTI
jgi:hypothetical protein